MFGPKLFRGFEMKLIMIFIDYYFHANFTETIIKCLKILPLLIGLRNNSSKVTNC